MSPTSPAADSLESLVLAGHTLRELEHALGLSQGYLSKVRHGAARPSVQLTALLEVVLIHPEALDTIRGATGATGASADAVELSPGLAMRELRALGPVFTAAHVRWAVTGDAALRLQGIEAPDSPGADVLVDPRDRHVLELLRTRGYALAHHPPELAICRLPTPDPNESLRLHFPGRPPLDRALLQVENRDGLPVIDLVTLTLANLLSQRSGAEASARAAVLCGVSVTELAARLDALDALPEPRSPYVLRTFDRTLARQRLARLA